MELEDLSINTFFTIICFLLITILLIISLSLLIILLRTVAGKSITNSEYPPVYGTVYGQVFYFNNLYDHLTKVAEKQRTFRLIAPSQSEIYTTEPRNIEHILKTKFDKYTKGNYNQEIVSDLFGEGIFAVDGEKWRRQRKLASYQFSTRVLTDFSCSVFKTNAVKLVQIVSEFSTAGRVFDIQDLVMRCALDSIFKVGFGVDLNCLEESKKGSEFMKAFDDSNALIFWRYIDPFWKFKRFLNISHEASIKKNIKVIHTFVHQLIQNKRDLLHQQNFNEKEEDILSRFLMESEKDPMGMNDEYLRDIVLNFILAGKDTTGGTLSWFLYMLCKNPLIQDKVVEEVRGIIGVEELELVDDVKFFMDKLTDSALHKMHYLHAALTETLRLYPAVPMDGRSAELDDILPDGHKVKRGDGVYYMAYSMGRMSYLWGEDAQEFKPERWLQNATFQPQSPFKFIAFHGGPRLCLGKEFSYQQMKIVSAALLQFFRFKLADETRNVTYKIMFTLHINGGLHLLAIPRKITFI